MFGLLKSKETKFWIWFEKNEDRLRNMKVEDENLASIIEEVGKALAKVNKNLSHEFCLEDVDGKREFIISAGGVAETVPYVEALFESKPELKNWNVVKFKQRKEFATLRCGEFEFTKDNVFFSLTKDKDKIDINFYFDNYADSLHNLYVQVGFNVLDAMLGEYQVMTVIDEIDWLPKEASSENIYPIRDLTNSFDLLRA